MEESKEGVRPLGAIIKEFRVAHRMSMRAFAEVSGISRPYIAMLEKNVRPDTGKPPVPSLDKVINAARAMNMDTSDLLDQIGMSISDMEAQAEAEHPNFDATKNPEGIRKIRPFEYIPVNQENFREAVREGRFILLPFKAPVLNGFVYVPVAEYGMAVAHTVTKVDGGVYEAYSEANGKITFSLFDIGVRVFMDRGSAKAAMRKEQGLDY